LTGNETRSVSASQPRHTHHLGRVAGVVSVTKIRTALVGVAGYSNSVPSWFTHVVPLADAVLGGTVRGKKGS
jgi:hypothetical protein